MPSPFDTHAQFTTSLIKNPDQSPGPDVLEQAQIELIEAGFGVKPKKKSVKEPEPLVRLLKVGADVEEFLRDKNGNPVVVCGLIGGTKDKPMPILGREGFALQEDNVALEYNIPPASTSYEFVYNLMRIREEINERLKKLDLVPAIEASMRFDLKQLQSEQALTFGCDPDFNVWEQRPNEKPEATEENANLRTAGGHIHMSFLVEGRKPEIPDDLGTIESIIMGLDIYVGAPFVLIDKDTDRRKLYGKAGAFRYKPEYGGVEYRVLSNHWTRSPQLMGYVYDQVSRLFRFINSNGPSRQMFTKYKSLVYDAINNGDERAAKRLMNYFGIMMPNNS